MSQRDTDAMYLAVSVYADDQVKNEAVHCVQTGSARGKF